MNTQIFKFRVDSVEFNSKDANLEISTPFNKVEINQEILKRLKAAGLTSKVEDFNYIVKEGQLHVQGLVYPIPKPQTTELIFSA